ncbi:MULTISPECIES: SpoIIE family protein phosphatase [unclassified Leptolyngbya]|uniref:SpoIIE family protein phosphatase n=1 Tax=unclassified Leptolyngbya TaxID=2650499 RepID=UPI0016872B7F|nr:MULTISPECIES: SpoIIE family protein phosphatase [unclassified Leptolyngbya]MBD1912157.1 SpoIIE family protein phosphatase [Leptolyngbya sp. FACHB-8]MBD2155048.1 SpoIIE family protein phosphatase [Leptolyngbya sp. FACHB-16]
MVQENDNKLRLMVVDDESDNLDLLYRTFRRDFQVFRAESALEALKILESSGEMAVIISDQRMPRMNGTELLSRVAEQSPDTIRILLTGYTDVEDLVDAINSGQVFKYVTKPWNPEELKSVVQQAAETYRLVKQRIRELNRALRRESAFNAVMSAIRESLDYDSMLQTIVATMGQTLAADVCLLHPLDAIGESADTYRVLSGTYAYESDSLEKEGAIAQIDRTGVGLEVYAHNLHPQVLRLGDTSYTCLLSALTYQQHPLALLALYRHTSKVPWAKDDIELLEAVASQAALAIFQAKLHQRIQKQSEQMQAELAVARQIQSNLLRQQLPKLDQVQIQACCHPAREVGGDFFEVYVHPKGDVWLGVGDVSGKGVPAALFMASAITVLRRELSQEISPEPDRVMQNLNSTLSDDLVSNNCFITMVLARYSPQTQELVYANAGHIYPLTWERIAAAEQAIAEPTYLKVRGVPLGILPHWKAPAGRLTLKSGEVLLLASDGLTEATLDNPVSGSQEMLRQSGLWKLFSQRNDLNLSEVLHYIQSHSPIQEDDQTILSLEVL